MSVRYGGLPTIVAALLMFSGCAKAVVPTVVAAVKHGAGEAHAHGVYESARSAELDPEGDASFPAAVPQPVPAGRKGRWIKFSNHNHSTYWDGKKPLTVMQQEAFLHGLDAFALTDHNTMRGANSPEFKLPPYHLKMVKGMEWNAWREHGEEVVGHATLLGLKGDENITTGFSIDRMLAEATRREATIVINHPFTLHNEWKAAKPDARVHGIEVWNGWWARVAPVIKNDRALAWWVAALDEGRRLTASAGTDNHGQWYDDIARNVNLVFVESEDEAGILDGYRKGRVTISQSPTSGRVYLEADANRDGVYEAMIGDELPVPASGKLAVRARVIGGQGRKVVFYTRKGRVAIERVDGPDATVALEVPVSPGFDYVRAELRRYPHLPLSMTAIANPIYLR